MEKLSIVIVGAKSTGNTPIQYGGVLTLSNGVVDYAQKVDIEVDIVNALRDGFELIPLHQRMASGFSRIIELTRLLHAKRRVGVVVFSGAGWSFYERVMLCAIGRFFSVPTILFIVDGWFFSVKKKSTFTRWLISFMLKVPDKLAASGSNWVTLFHELDVEDKHIVTVHYWLSSVETSNRHLKCRHLADNLVVKFCFVGWMIKEKGIYEIIEALEILLPKYQIFFTFVGGGTLVEEIREIIINRGWERNVSALGWLSQQDRDEVIANSDVFVLPSYAEGFPMSLIEAMTVGLPAIVTDVGAVADSLHDKINGILIPPRDAQALANAMEFYFTNPTAVSDHSLAALRIVQKNHDPGTNCKLLLDALGATN